MSGVIATAYVKLIPTFDKQLSTSIKKQLDGADARKAGTAAGSRIGKLFSRGVDSGMGSLKTAMTSRFSAASVAVGGIAASAVTKAFSAVASSVDAAISRVDTINNFPRIMEGMGIGAEASAAAVRRLSDGIDGLPTALDDAVSGVSRFTAKNGDIDKSTDYFLAVNNAITAGGASMQIQSSALEQLSQSYSKGKMDMMEWRSLQQAMPAQLNQIAESMGITADQLGEGLRKGSISMDEFMDKIVELNKDGVNGLDSFEQQARKASGGIGTALTNVQNRVNKAVAGVIDAIGQENIAGAINSFSSQFGKIGQIIGGLDDGKVVGFIGGLKSGLDSAFEGWSPSFEINWDGMFSGMRDSAQKAGEWLAGPLSTAVKVVDEGMSHLADTFQAAAARLNLPEIDWGAVADGISQVIEVVGGFTFDAIGTAVFQIANVGSMLGDAFAPFVDRIGPGLESAARGISEFVSPIADFLSGHGPAFEGMMDRIQGHIDDMAPILDDIAGHFNNFCQAMEPIASAVGPIVAEVLANIASAFVGMGTIVLQVADAIMIVFEKIAEGLNFLGQVVDIAATHFIEGWEPAPPMLWDVNEGIEQVTDSANKVPTERSVAINLNDNASPGLRNIISQLDNIRRGAMATVSSMISGLFAASGGITHGPMSLIPRHADGGISGIATKPTLTNIGWVGEAGAEAIIPLTNRRYVRPFAHAVASEMGAFGQQGVNEYHITVNASGDGDAIAREVTRAIRAQNLMSGRR